MILLAHDGTIKIDTKLDKSGVESGLSSLKSIASKSFAAIGAAAAVGIGAAVKAGMDFESAFAGVKKTVDATDAQLAALESGIRRLSNVMPTSAVEIAGVAEAAGQLGIQTDNILAFTETMVMLGDATNMSAETAATTLARFANITGMSQDNFDRLGATIVALGNNFATTEAEIADMALNIASAGTQVGMSEAQIMGFATALSSVGMEAQAGGTAISKLMIDMQLATETGGEALNQFAHVAGMSAEQFSQAFQEDAASAVSSFLTGLSDTERLGKNAISVLDEMGISEVRLRDTILRAANSGELFTEALQTGTRAWEENTALVNEAKQRYETLESKLGMLKNALVDLGISIYQSLEEPLKNAVLSASDMISGLQEKFSNNGFSGLIDQIGMIITQISTNIASHAPSMIGAATQLIQALINGISDNLPALTQAAANIITSIVKGITALLPSILNLGKNLIVSILNGIRQAIPEIVSAVPEIISAITETFAIGMPEMIESGMQLMLGLAEGIVNAIPDLISRLPEIIASITEGISSSLPEIVETGVQIIMQLAAGIIQALPELVVQLPNIIFAIANGINSMVGSLIECGVQIVHGIWDGIISAAGTVVEAVSHAVTNAISAAKNAASQAFDVGASIISGMVSGVISKVQSLWNAAKNAVMGAINAAKSALNINSPSRVTRDEIGKPMIDGVAGALANGAAGLAASFSGSVIGAVKSVKNRMKIHSPSRVTYDELGVPLIEGVAIAISDHAYEVSEAFENALSDLDLLRDYDIISEAEYYNRLETLRDEHVKAGTEDWHKYTLELLKFDKDQAEKAYEIAERKYEKGEYNEKQYYAELTRIRDQYFNQNTNAWNAFNDRILEDVLGRYNDHIAELKDQITESFQEIADASISSFKEIKSAEDALAGRLKSYGSLIETHTYTGLGENGGDLVITKLADLSEQTKELDAYNDALLQIRERAGDDRSKSLFNLLRDMDIGEAVQAANLLLDASDEEFNKYVDAHNKKDETIGSIANNLYQSEYTEAANAATKAFNTELKKIKGQFEELYSEIPPEFFECGLESAEQFSAGFVEKEFDKYVDSYNEYKEKVGESAHDLYQDNYTETANAASEAFDAELEKIKAQLEEVYGEIPPGFFECGLESAEQFGAGIMEKLNDVFENVRVSISSFMAGFSPQFALGIGGAAAAAQGSQTYAPTYQIYNPTGDANAAIQAAKRREQLDRLRGMSG